MWHFGEMSAFRKACDCNMFAAGKEMSYICALIIIIKTKKIRKMMKRMAFWALLGDCLALIMSALSCQGVVYLKNTDGGLL